MKHILIAQGATAPTAPSSKIDLVSNWNTVWGKVKSAGGLGPLDNILLAVGAILILLSILQWLWKRRTGQSGNNQHVAWTLLLGAFLMLPQVLIPAALTIVDVIVNAIASIAG